MKQSFYTRIFFNNINNVDLHEHFPCPIPISTDGNKNLNDGKEDWIPLSSINDCLHTDINKKTYRNVENNNCYILSFLYDANYVHFDVPWKLLLKDNVIPILFNKALKAFHNTSHMNVHCFMISFKI